MDKPRFRHPYRTAAILAAFSRASDDAPRAALAGFAGVETPQRETTLRLWAQMARHRLTRGMAAFGIAWPVDVADFAARGARPPCGLTADPNDPRGPPPVLASHFDLGHTADLVFELLPDARERAA